jgi:hypothetical protein
MSLPYADLRRRKTLVHAHEGTRRMAMNKPM